MWPRLLMRLIESGKCFLRCDALINMSVIASICVTYSVLGLRRGMPVRDCLSSRIDTKCANGHVGNYLRKRGLSRSSKIIMRSSGRGLLPALSVSDFGLSVGWMMNEECCGRHQWRGQGNMTATTLYPRGPHMFPLWTGLLLETNRETC
jgi:hypothetical protein